MTRKVWVARWYVGYLDFRLRGLAQPDSIVKIYATKTLAGCYRRYWLFTSLHRKHGQHRCTVDGVAASKHQPPL